MHQHQPREPRAIVGPNGVTVRPVLRTIEKNKG